MAQLLMNSMAFSGIMYFPIWHSFMHFLETTGTTGCSRSVSFTMAWMYGRLEASDSLTSRVFPTTRSISSRAFLSTVGLLMSSDSVQSIDDDVVSVPAVNMSWKERERENCFKILLINLTGQTEGLKEEKKN